MSISIRLKREGAKNQPFYRIIVADKRDTSTGRFIEKLGYYNPLPDKEIVHIEKERVIYWLDKGAEVSTTVKSILKKLGVVATQTQKGKKTD